MKKKYIKGFTLIEVLVVIAIIGVLAAAVIAALNPITQIRKATDARRKSDLAQIQRGFELYYNDNQKYPTAASLPWGAKWQSASGAVYMPLLPKDPGSGKTYAYWVSADGQTYYLYASLDRGGQDPQACNIAGTACPNAIAHSLSCGGICNYGVSSANTTR